MPATSSVDQPRYTGPHKPSPQLEPYLKYLFPNVVDAQNNIFFRYREDQGFLSEVLMYLKYRLSNDMFLWDNDVTIVIEDGANATDVIDRMLTASWISIKGTSGLYNCYQRIITWKHHKYFSTQLSFLITMLVHPNYRRIIKHSERSSCQLSGPIVHEFGNDQVSLKASSNMVLYKRPEFSFIPEYRSQISTALGQEAIPTFVTEVATSQCPDGLLRDVSIWLGGSMLLVESVLAFTLWKKTLSVCFYQFDCRVENLLRLLDEYHMDDWKVRCLRIVIRYKCLRWLIDLQLISFLLEHNNECFYRVQRGSLTLEIEERFQKANRVISEYRDRLRELGDTRTYEICPERGLVVNLTHLIRHREQIRDEIRFYQYSLTSLAREAEADHEVTLVQAIVTVSGIIFEQSLRPVAIMGPVYRDHIVSEHIHLPLFLKYLVGFTHELMQLAAEELTGIVRYLRWRIMDLQAVSIQLKEIKWRWIEKPLHIARKNETTVNKLRRKLGYYLQGRINLEHLSWDGLWDIDNSLRALNTEKTNQLENLSIGTDRYMVEIFRYLASETIRNSQNTRHSLEWSVNLQYSLHNLFQQLHDTAEHDERDERAAAEQSGRYKRRVARYEAN
uniref:ARAD1A10208p n=1 Tax=Blastobotrys adeninivorans TaxID=409370 RepID=A0A060SXK8_BLAAD